MSQRIPNLMEDLAAAKGLVRARDPGTGMSKGQSNDRAIGIWLHTLGP